MDSLNLESYRKKGINAYAVPLRGLRWDKNDCDYGTPLTKEDRELAFKSKPHTVEIDLSKPKFLNCYLKFKEASGHRTVYGWLLIKDGEIIKSFDSEDEYALHVANELIELPKLEGSEKQIKWAESIRAKAILELYFDLGIEVTFHSDYFKSLNHSKNWIEGFGTDSYSSVAVLILNSLK